MGPIDDGGNIALWHKMEGDSVTEGEDLVDIETDKITNSAASPATGLLRRIVAERGSRAKVGHLIAVIAGEAVSGAAIDSYVNDYLARTAIGPETEDKAPGLSYELAQSRFGPVRLGRAGVSAGNPVLFIHGFASDMHSWAFNMNVLKNRPLIAIDLPGHGASTKEVGDGSATSLADATSDVVCALRVGKIDVVAHSLGCSVALRLADAIPESIGKMVLIAPPGLKNATVSEAFIDGLIGARRARELRVALEMLVADRSRITNEMIDQIIKYKRLDGVPNAINKFRDFMLDGRAFADTRVLVERFKPLIISGENDLIVGSVESADVSADIRVANIPGAGHMPHVEKPEQVNTLLRQELGREEGT